MPAFTGRESSAGAEGETDLEKKDGPRKRGMAYENRDGSIMCIKFSRDDQLATVASTVEHTQLPCSCYDPKGPKQAEAIRYGGLLVQPWNEQCQELDSSTGE